MKTILIYHNKTSENQAYLMVLDMGVLKLNETQHLFYYYSSA